jgi:hypothetical protein
MDEPLLAKGTSLVDLVKMARKQRADFERLLPEETRRLLDTRILGGSWYPEQHLRDLLVAADRVLGKGDLTYCRKLGKVAAHQALEKTYRAVVVPGDVVASLRLLAVSWTFMHNTGTVTVQTPSEGVVRVALERFGLPSRALCAVFAGWLEGKVEVAGGQARVVEEKCRVRGDEACVYAVHWSLASGPPPA